MKIEPSRSKLLERIAELEARLEVFESGSTKTATADAAEASTFRSIADTTPLMIWVAGLDKGCTFFNKPWLDFTGRTLDEELGDGWAAGVHPEDQDACIATYCSAFDSRERFQLEYRLRRADGQYRWILDSGLPLNRDGAFVGYIGWCVDITEQKLIKARLRASELQLKDAQRLAGVGSFQFDIGSGLAQWSDEVYHICGVSADSPPMILGFMGRVHPQDRSIVLAARDKALSSTDTVDLQFRITRPDGTVRFVRSKGQAIRNDQGTAVRLIGAMQDVTEQVSASEYLRESEQRLQRAEFLANVGNWSVDFLTNGLVCSMGVYRIFGFSEDYVPSFERWLDAVLPHDRARVKQWCHQWRDEKRAQPIEFQITRRDGEVRILASTSELVFGEDGALLRVFGTIQDVTATRRAHEELFARQKLESIGTLASGIAHDFNNLLSSILAQADLASAELSAGSKPEGELDAIRSVALRGAEIVRQLMIYSGTETAGPDAVDISQTVAEMTEILKISLSKDVVLETDLAEHLPSVHGNAAQVSQIVMNLVTNASDAIGGGGGVIRIASRRIRIPSGESARAAASVPSDEYAQLEVSDTGCGMLPETQARIFDPFFTTKLAGHGLGLAAVDGIVRALGGTIEVRSELGKGSTFTVTLPAVRGTPARSDGTRSGEKDVSATGLRKSTLLFVEDEDVTRKALATMLRNAGFDVLEAADGSSAIATLRDANQKIDAMLLDMSIPGPSSKEVLSEAAYSQPTAKVLLTSAYNEEMVRSALSGPLVRGFIRKPFAFASLIQNLRSIL